MSNVGRSARISIAPTRLNLGLLIAICLCLEAWLVVAAVVAALT